VVFGGGGLLSTASDYAKFCQMLLNGGELNGVRLLSPQTMALMSSDHLPPGILRSGYEDMAPTLEMGPKLRARVAVRTDAGRNPLPGLGRHLLLGRRIRTTFWIDSTKQRCLSDEVQMPFPQSGYYPARFLRIGLWGLAP